ncbi:MAG: AzlD domain-containing protein [Chromatiales bacterium]|nr:AzlD domain-containing protein [Chromatiales bacterium]
MSDIGYLLLFIAVMAGVTFLTRVLPFVAFRKNTDHHVLDYLGRYMPPVIMTILVVYSLKNIDITTTPYGATELLAVALTAAVHLLWRNALVSIFSGTALYVFFVQSGVMG